MNFKHKLSKRMAIIWAGVALFACVGEQPTTPVSTDLSIPPGISTPTLTGTATLLFEENFDDGAFASRGWYDNTSMVTTTAEHVSGSARALELRFLAGATTPVAGGAARRQFPATPTVYVSYWVKYSANWIGSGQAYHPHEFLIVSDQDGAWDGPAQSWLVAYVEHNYQNGGIPRLQLQDNKAINTSFGSLPVDLVNTTEDRSTSGCNGVVEANVVTTCFNMPPWYNDKEVHGPGVAFKPVEGPGYKGNWNHVEAYFQLNSIANGKGIADGVMQYWFNGALIIDRHDILFRTAARPNIQFDKFMIAPYIGDGSPVSQTMWVDNLQVATGRIATDSVAPPPPPPPPPPASGAPGTVSYLAVAAVADSGVTLSFTEVSDGNGQPASYDIRFAKGSLAWGAGTDVASGTCKVPVAGTTIGAKRTCTLRGLTPSTAYQMQLVSFRGTLNVDAVFGGLSNVVSATTSASPPPPPPSTATNPGTVADLVVTAVTDTSATLSFTEVNDGTGAPAKYYVRFKSPTITTWGSATDVTKGGCKVPLSGTTIGVKRSCKVQGLTASTAYQFQMVAFRGTLNVDAVFGGLSNVAGGVTTAKPVVLTKPGTVADLAVSGSDDSTITLAFTEVNDGSGKPASYFVRFGPAPFSWGAGNDVSRGSCKVPMGGTAIGARRTCTIAGLTPGTNYQAQMVAFRGTLNVDAEFGELSVIASGTTTNVVSAPPPPPPVPPPPPPPSGGAWPNEPAGFTLLSDYGFGDFVPATNQGDMLGAGWRIWWNDRGLGTLAQDNTAPQSPSGVFQVHYPIGWLSGYEPTMTEYVFSPHVTELYWGFWWKPSNPFQSDASGVNKIAFVWTPSGATDLIYFDLSPGPWRIRAMDDLIAGGGPRAGLRDEPNVATTVITLGQWHRIEIYVKYSSGGLANGVLKWWVDGTLNGHYTNLKMVQDGGFDHLQFAPTYGGNTGDRKTEDDYYWYDHVRVSRGP